MTAPSVVTRHMGQQPPNPNDAYGAILRHQSVIQNIPVYAFSTIATTSHGTFRGRGGWTAFSIPHLSPPPGTVQPSRAPVINRKPQPYRPLVSVAANPPQTPQYTAARVTAPPIVTIYSY